MELILNCFDNEKFLNNYKKQLSYTTISSDITRVHNIDQCPQEIKQTLTEFNYLNNEDIMILSPDNTNFIKEIITEHSNKVISKLIPEFESIRAKLVKEWFTLEHNLVCHIMLSSIWQKLWEKKTSNNNGGNVFLVESFDDCPLMYSKFIPVKKGLITLFIRTPLQENNQSLDICLTEQKMNTMIQTIDDEGYLLPIGSRELQLITLKLVKVVRKRDDYVGSYKFVAPRVNKDLLMKINSELIDITRIGSTYLNGLIKIIDNNYDLFLSKYGQTLKHNLYQATKYVANYLIVESLIKANIIRDFDKVPPLVGIGPMVMLSYGIG